MAISIDWATKIITIPQSDLTLISPNLYELDVDWFRLQLKNLEDSEDGMCFPDTHRHNTEVSLSGVTYARIVEIINGYTITFEDGPYTVKCVGANHNISDVKNVNQVSLIVTNSAGLVVTSASGGGSSPTAAQIATEVWERLLSSHVNISTMGGMINLLNTRTTAILNSLSSQNFKIDLLLSNDSDILIDTAQLLSSLSLALDILNTILKYSANRTKIDRNEKTLTIYDDDGTTPIKIFQLKDFDGVASITEISERMPQ